MQDSLIAIGSELVPIALEELVLELNPMKTDCMQEALQQVHAHKHSEGDGPQRHPGGNTLKKQTIKVVKNIVLTIAIVPNTVSCAKAPAKRRFKKVSASCWCASERAHSLKYEAVLETVPKANSIVSIIWWTKTSPKE